LEKSNNLKGFAGLTLEGEEVALWLLTSLCGSRPVILPSRFANFNCFNGKTSVYFYYKISVFQTAIVK
jgi:hypothetical protein